MQIRVFAAALVLAMSATSWADDPLELTLPSGKKLHFADQDQKARFEAALAKKQQPQPTPIPTPTPTPATPKPSIFPLEVVVTHSAEYRARHGEYTVEYYEVPLGTKLRVLAISGIVLEVDQGSGMRFRIPAEWTDYQQRHIPEQPPLSPDESASFSAAPLLRSAF